MRRLLFDRSRSSRPRIVPPTPGSVLRQLRLQRGLSQAQVAQFYTEKGATVARISQIESSALTTKTVECCYRAAVDTAIMLRNQRRAKLTAK